LRGRSGAAVKRTLYWKTPNARALRQGDWKLIVYNNGKAELYNLARDPYEQTDLAADDPDLLVRLQQSLAHISAGDR